MNRKTTYLMLGVLIVLFGLWGSQNRWRAKRSATEAARQPLVEDFQPAAVDTIEILPGKNRGKLQAFRLNGGWMLQGILPLPADPIAVDRIIKAIGRAKISRVAANNRDNLDQFGLTEEQRATVKLLSGGAPRYEFWLGVSSEDFLSAYATRDNDPRVYFIEGFTREDIAEDWRDLTVLQFDQKKATQIAYAQKRGGFTLSRDAADEWTLDGRATKLDAVKELIRELANLRAEDMAATHATFTPTGTTIEINTPSGTQALLIGPAHPAGGVFVKTTTDYVYTLSKNIKEKILPARRSLLQ